MTTYRNNLAQKPLVRLVNGKVDWDSYYRVVIAFSGGKDSIACLIECLDLGCPKEKIELWHHIIDGREGAPFMDWHCTESYCKKAAEAFGVPIYFSWKKFGFEGEMLRDNAPTAATCFETPMNNDVLVVSRGGESNKKSSRLIFPQVSGDLVVRYCSAYLKIDIAACAYRNQERFKGKEVLFITGERAEESAGRSTYPEMEPYRGDDRAKLYGQIKSASRVLGLRRKEVKGKVKPNNPFLTMTDEEIQTIIDDTWEKLETLGQGLFTKSIHWRPVFRKSTKEVWAMLAKYKVNAHPCYRLGWGRCSCAACIFGNPDQYASLRAVTPILFKKVADYEQRWFNSNNPKSMGKTIHRGENISQRADRGVPYAACSNPLVIAEALDPNWNGTIFLDNWEEPAGATADLTGPC